VDQFLAIVYARPEYIETLRRSTPIADHVRVDFELRGCPINKQQLLEVISAYLHGRKPNTPPQSVCMECKRRGTVCVMVAGGIPCLGPVTQVGCGAICPAYARGCYGCYGPKETPNTAALAVQWRSLGANEQTLVRAFRGFNAYADAFRRESEAHEYPTSQN
jgi:sulfhydrogenase subunit delta